MRSAIRIGQAAFLRSIYLTLIILGATMPALAQSQSTKVSGRTIRFVDAPLITAQGQVVRLKDLFAQRRVLLSFTFTGCQKLCPPSDAIMEIVAQQLRTGGRKDIQLATITLDPLSDTPEQLRRNRADVMDPDRLFLSGIPNDVWSVLNGLGIETGPNQDHDVQFLIIGVGGRTIIPNSGLADPEVLIRALAAVQ